jgi:predicted nucleic acid-binding Zn finger protein
MSALDPVKLKVVEDKADIVMDDPKPGQVKKHLKQGDRVSYIGTDNKYRSGGFVLSIVEDGSSFVISGGNLKWSLRTDKVRRLFIVQKE